MAVLEPRYSKEEFARQGQAIYERDIRPNLGAGDDGKSRYNPKLWMGGMREAAYPSA